MKKNNKTEFDLLYPQVWNQYNIYYQSYAIYNSKFNIIGVVASVFIAVLLTVAGSWSWLLYIPILGLLIPFILALLNLKYDKVKIPWLDKHQLVKNLQGGKSEYYEALIDDVFEATNTLLAYKRFAHKWVSISIWSIVISIVLASSFTMCKLLQPIICG